MALFDKFKSLIDSHAAVKAVGADPFSVKMERVLSPTEAIIEGQYHPRGHQQLSRPDL